jgi:hypothetical protein
MRLRLVFLAQEGGAGAEPRRRAAVAVGRWRRRLEVRGDCGVGFGRAKWLPGPGC